MNLYYLVNSVETPNHKYFRTGSDIGGESYDGTNNLLDARFFVDKKIAESYIHKANSWWTKYDFHVESITSSKLIAMLKQSTPKTGSFYIDIV